jgi:hypothetical protein
VLVVVFVSMPMAVHVGVRMLVVVFVSMLVVVFVSMLVVVFVSMLVVVFVSMLVVVFVPNVRMVRITFRLVVMSVVAPRIVSLGHARCILLAVREGPVLMLSGLRRRGRALT